MRAVAALRRRQRSILPYALARCAEVFAGSARAASTTIGFRHGGHVTATKLFEARQTIEDGGQELDVVINISKTRSGDWTYVHTELQALTKLIHSEGAKIKVIFENAYLDDTEKIRLCEICGVIGLDWVKASTGYAASGAAIADLELMRRHSPANVQVKAAGDIRDLDALLAVREIGVSRVGATRTETMLEDCRKRLGLSPISHQTVSVSLTIVATRMVLTRIAIKEGTQATASSREEQRAEAFAAGEMFLTERQIAERMNSMTKTLANSDLQTVTRRELISGALKNMLVAGMPGSLVAQMHAAAGWRAINIVNVIRAEEPRGPTDLLLPVREQMASIKTHNLPATWLLQYDAIVEGPFVPFLKKEMPADHEVGIWFEMNRILCDDAGIPWRGNPQWE